MLRLLDSIVAAIFLALAVLVFLVSREVLEAAAEERLDRSWSLVASLWGAGGVVAMFVLLAARPVEGFRRLLREPFITGVRRAARSMVQALADGQTSLRFVVFLHSFDGEASARTKTAKARDLEGLRSLERYFAGRLGLILLWPVVRVIRVLWTRLPIWRSTDEYLCEALWPEYLVVSVGGREGSLGAFGTQAIEAANALWRDRVERLAQIASALVVVPGTTHSIREEINWIASSAVLRSKSVFVWPAMEDARRSAYATASDMVFDSGVRVPHFDERGLIFDLEGHSETLEHFLNSPAAVRRIVIDRKWRNEPEPVKTKISVAAVITLALALIIALSWLSDLWRA